MNLLFLYSEHDSFPYHPFVVCSCLLLHLPVSCILVWFTLTCSGFYGFFIHGHHVDWKIQPVWWVKYKNVFHFYRQWKSSGDAVSVAAAVACVAGGAAGFILHFIASLMVREHTDCWLSSVRSQRCFIFLFDPPGSFPLSWMALIQSTYALRLIATARPSHIPRYIRYMKAFRLLKQLSLSSPMGTLRTGRLSSKCRCTRHLLPLTRAMLHQMLHRLLTVPAPMADDSPLYSS